jgi:transposase InsO family protein
VTPTSRREYAHAIRQRYAHASRAVKSQMLTEFRATTGYHRKYAIAVLSTPPAPTPPPGRRRAPTYVAETVTVLGALWEVAGYPWAARLTALLPVWLPWAKQHLSISPQVEHQLRTISPSTIDRRLRGRKRRLKRRLYGRTKPGTLLKHYISLKTDHWDVTAPGFTEMDLVSHSGNSADGAFLQTLNLTDIHTGWSETYAIMGKSQTAVRPALEALRQALPFALRGVDSDNGSEFIHAHLFRYCAGREIQCTRGRPYKKDDSAHIEQKNWTHVRKLLGWDRYDSPEALAAITDLYRHELRLVMNLFQPSVKLVGKVRPGARLTRRYDAPQTPLDRLAASQGVDPATVAALQQLRQRVDPFALAEAIDQKLAKIHRLANRRHSPPPDAVHPAAPPRCDRDE